MRIKRSELKRLIKEEIQEVFQEVGDLYGGMSEGQGFQSGQLAAGEVEGGVQLRHGLEATSLGEWKQKRDQYCNRTYGEYGRQNEACKEYLDTGIPGNNGLGAHGEPLCTVKGCTGGDVEYIRNQLFYESCFSDWPDQWVPAGSNKRNVVGHLFPETSDFHVDWAKQSEIKKWEAQPKGKCHDAETGHQGKFGTGGSKIR
jgi:hypothetical protein